MKKPKIINLPALDLNLPKTHIYTLPSQIYLRPADYRDIITKPSSEFYDMFLYEMENGKIFNEQYIFNKAMYVVLLHYIASLKINNPIKNTDYFSTAGDTVRLYFDVGLDKYSIEIPLVQDVYYSLQSFTTAHQILCKTLMSTDSRHLYMTSNVLEISLKIAWLPLIRSE